MPNKLTPKQRKDIKAVFGSDHDAARGAAQLALAQIGLGAVGGGVAGNAARRFSPQRMSRLSPRKAVVLGALLGGAHGAYRALETSLSYGAGRVDRRRKMVGAAVKAARRGDRDYLRRGVNAKKRGAVSEIGGNALLGSLVGGGLGLALAPSRFGRLVAVGAGSGALMGGSAQLGRLRSIGVAKSRAFDRGHAKTAGVFNGMARRLVGPKPTLGNIVGRTLGGVKDGAVGAVVGHGRGVPHNIIQKMIFDGKKFSGAALESLDAAKRGATSGAILQGGVGGVLGAAGGIADRVNHGKSVLEMERLLNAGAVAGGGALGLGVLAARSRRKPNP